MTNSIKYSLYATIEIVARHSEGPPRYIARRFDGGTKNAGFNAKVQRIAGIYPHLDRLLSYLQWYRPTSAKQKALL